MGRPPPRAQRPRRGRGRRDRLTPEFAFIGFGELGSALAAALGDAEVRVYVRSGERAGSIEEAVAGADVVLAVVPAGAVRDVAEQAVPHLAPGALYVDVAPLLPAEKEELAALIGPGYVDAQVLGTTAADGAAVPFLASGPGAAAWCDAMAPYGFEITVLDGPPGAASLVKLLRSVYMKGRDALIAEMLLAARRYGVDEQLLGTIRGGGEQVPFPELASRVVTALAIHAGRRADELESSAEVLRAVGVDPTVTTAGADRLRALAELGLRDRFAGERPADFRQVLDAIDELLREPGAKQKPD